MALFLGYFHGQVVQDVGAAIAGLIWPFFQRGSGFALRIHLPLPDFSNYSVQQ